MDSKNFKATKTSVPQVLQKVLPRRSVAEIIDNASLDEMIYLVAPYGSGKTMAVLSWIRERGKKTAWVSLNNENDTALSFWAYFTTAILSLVDEQEKAENILSNPDFITNPLKFIKETLIRVSPSISEKILVIDNFRFIRNGGLLREIKAVISAMLAYWRIIVIGQIELSPIFNDFMLKGHLRMIKLNELNFSLEEISEYFSMNGIVVEGQDLYKILEDTDGWPAALNVILTVPQNGNVSYNDTAKAYVKDFFELEIWKKLDTESKDFLLKTSVLDKLTPSICRYATGVEGAHSILRSLYAKGIFLQKLDEMDTYCYHCVFRDFLLDKLYHSGIDANNLYVNIGWWLYERNESISALRYFFMAKDFYGINQAFKKVKPADMGIEKYLEATFYLTSLDIEDLKDYPEVAVRIALLHFITGDINKTKRIQQTIHGWLEPGALAIPPEEYIDLYWEAGWLRYVDPDTNIVFNKEFDDWVNVAEYAPRLVGAHRSRASVLRLPSILRGVRDYSAEANRAVEYYDKNKETGEYVRDKTGLFHLDLIMAEIAYEQEDFIKAEKLIKRTMPEFERERLSELYFAGTVLLVKISRAIHNPDEATELTNRLKTLIEKNGHLFLLPNLHAFELRNRLANGIQGVTEIFDKENKPYLNTSHFYLIYRHITYVRALLSEGKFSKAILVLGSLDLLCRQYQRNLDLIEINILFSIAEYSLEHEPDAYYHLKMALDEGQKHSFIRIFSDDAALLWPVLNLLHKPDINKYVQRIIISCKKALTRTGIAIGSNKSLDPLTRKEIEILKLLATGMSYKEIALENGVKLGTVGTQIHSIYAKLNVNNRTSAVVWAQKQGILDNLLLPTDTDNTFNR